MNESEAGLEPSSLTTSGAVMKPVSHVHRKPCPSSISLRMSQSRREVSLVGDMNVWEADFQSTATAQGHTWPLQSLTSMKT